MAAVPDLRDQRFARAIDREVAPIWHDRFSRLAWRHLPRLESGLVLDVHCGPGRTTAEILSRTGPDVRVVGLEPSPTMRDLAKAKMRPEWKHRYYFKPGDFGDVADMADDTYELVLCNLVLSEAQDTKEALEALVRVTKPGGTVLATFPMAGSWAEPEDLFAEVLRDTGLTEAVARLDRLASLRPTGDQIARLALELGIEGEELLIDQERFGLLFNSAREFLFSPLVEYGPLRLWKAIIGQGANPQELFFRFKATIDAYYDRAVFSVSANAGLLAARVPGVARHRGLSDAFWRHYPNLDAMFRTAEGRTSGHDLELDFEIDIEDLGADEELAATPAIIEEQDTVPHFIAPAHRRSAASISAEDEAIFALLDQSSHRNEPDAELDALLDQVLEFADPGAVSAGKLEPSDPPGLARVGPTDVKKAGETLKRIQALLPPPPDEAADPQPPSGAQSLPPSRPAPRTAPPPPPRGKLKGRKR